MCDVCKQNKGPLFKNTLHFLKFRPIVIKLCFKHDVELFKKGQDRFLKTYEAQLSSKLSEKEELGDSA